MSYTYFNLLIDEVRHEKEHARDLAVILAEEQSAA